jgi:hypothetical protein
MDQAGILTHLYQKFFTHSGRGISKTRKGYTVINRNLQIMHIDDVTTYSKSLSINPRISWNGSCLFKPDRILSVNWRAKLREARRPYRVIP